VIPFLNRVLSFDLTPVVHIRGFFFSPPLLMRRGGLLSSQSAKNIVGVRYKWAPFKIAGHRLSYDPNMANFMAESL
jgi:hypothetical protein